MWFSQGKHYKLAVEEMKVFRILRQLKIWLLDTEEYLSVKFQNLKYLIYFYI